MAIKRTQWQQNRPNGHNLQTSFIARHLKIYPNWDFWFENIPSGNPGSHCLNAASFWTYILPLNITVPSKIPIFEKNHLINAGQHKICCIFCCQTEKIINIFSPNSDYSKWDLISSSFGRRQSTLFHNWPQPQHWGPWKTTKTASRRFLDRSKIFKVFPPPFLLPSSQYNYNYK
jgi:hypothetical protein